MGKEEQLKEFSKDFRQRRGMFRTDDAYFEMEKYFSKALDQAERRGSAKKGEAKRSYYQMGYKDGKARVLGVISEARALFKGRDHIAVLDAIEDRLEN